MAKTKLGFEVLSIVDIPQTYLSKGIIRELAGREMQTDTDTDLDEKIYTADIFQQMLDDQIGQEGSPIALSPEDLKQIEKIAKDLKNHELIRITTI